MKEEDFIQMVREVNETEVAQEDILSNNIYLYRAAVHQHPALDI